MFRGSHQKVIAFTFYSGPTYDTYHRDYFTGIESNLDLMKQFYGPDWLMRLYYQVPKNSLSEERLCKIACSDLSIDLCNAEDIPRFGNWTCQLLRVRFCLHCQLLRVRVCFRCQLSLFFTFVYVVRWCGYAFVDCLLCMCFLLFTTNNIQMQNLFW
jgi:hypothetical protein